MAEWMEDDLVKDIAKEKLNMLSEMMTLSRGKNQQQLLASLVPFIKKAKQDGMTFTSEEIKACVAAIQKHSSPEENAKIDEMLKKASL